MNFSHLTRVAVPAGIVSETEEHLRRAGRRGLELFVLWSGLPGGAEFQVRTIHVPQQTSYRLESGLLVRVEGNALHQLNTWLYEHREALAVQVHAHPTEAYHSTTDDTYPIVTAQGSISIVAADFCRHGLLAKSTAVYRLKGKEWMELDDPLELFRVS